MDNVDWAENAAQINYDIRLANSHLPPEMQARPPLLLLFCSAGILRCIPHHAAL